MSFPFLLKSLLHFVVPTYVYNLDSLIQRKKLRFVVQIFLNTIHFIHTFVQHMMLSVRLQTTRMGIYRMNAMDIWSLTESGESGILSA